jgi:metal-sulfur cluster biosynthetic enzyme
VTEVGLRHEVDQALGRVLDPCSVFNGSNLSLADLGMVERVDIVEGEVNVQLFLDDPTCLFYFEITRNIRAELEALEGVCAVTFEMKVDEIWTEDRMLPVARQRLQLRRAGAQARRGATGLVPLPMAQQDEGRSDAAVPHRA